MISDNYENKHHHIEYASRPVGSIRLISIGSLSLVSDRFRNLMAAIYRK